MFSFLRRLFRPSDKAKLLAFEVAHREWQSTEGAGRQRELAKLLSSSVCTAVRDYLHQADRIDLSTHVKDLNQIVTQVTWLWRLKHLIDAPGLRSPEYHVRVSMTLNPVFSWMAPSYQIHQSGSLDRLSQGRALIEIHDEEAPRYRMGFGDWERHRVTCAIYAAEIQQRSPSRKIDE